VTYSIAGGAETQVPELKLVRNFRDSWSLRAGAEVRPLKWLRLRAGYYFEPGAVAEQSISVAANDVQKHGLTVGAGVDVWKLRISAGYSHAFFATHVVTDSTQRSLNPLQPDAGTIVGNGRYQFAYDVFSLGVAVTL
jgi:long-subunit fatty acid transport protein